MNVMQNEQVNRLRTQEIMEAFQTAGDYPHRLLSHMCSGTQAWCSIWLDGLGLLIDHRSLVLAVAKAQEKAR